MNSLEFFATGDLVFDVGAHAGSKAQIYLAKGARVVCFEPQPALADNLRERFGERVVIEQVALGSSPGKLPMRIAGTTTVSTLATHWGTGRFFGEPYTHTIEVEVDTLDRAVTRYGTPAFTKIDVEGFEREILSGLSCRLPALSFEFTCEFLDHARECVDRLCGLGMERFNYGLGEHLLLESETWLTAVEVFHRLASSSDPLLWGDIYAAS
jgi:FkbM family methyltransferase